MSVFKTGDIVISDGFLYEYVHESKDGYIVYNMNGYKIRISLYSEIRLATDEDVEDYISKNLNFVLLNEEDEFKNEIKVTIYRDYLFIDTGFDSVNLDMEMSYKLAKALCKHFDIKG